MVDEFSAVIEKLQRQKGALALFALVKMDDHIDRWTVVVSAEWITDQNVDDSFKYVLQTIIASVSPECLNSMARLGVYTLEEHLVQDLLKYKQGTHIAESVRANGNIVHEGYVIVSA
jgi:hypothetical protein